MESINGIPLPVKSIIPVVGINGPFGDEYDPSFFCDPQLRKFIEVPLIHNQYFIPYIKEHTE